MLMARRKENSTTALRALCGAIEKKTQLKGCCVKSLFSKVSMLPGWCGYCALMGFLLTLDSQTPASSQPLQHRPHLPPTSTERRLKPNVNSKWHLNMTLGVKPPFIKVPQGCFNSCIFPLLASSFLPAYFKRLH